MVNLIHVAIAFVVGLIICLIILAGTGQFNKTDADGNMLDKKGNIVYKQVCTRQSLLSRRNRCLEYENTDEPLKKSNVFVSYVLAIVLGVTGGAFIIYILQLPKSWRYNLYSGALISRLF
jgi:hypothetical protein